MPAAPAPRPSIVTRVFRGALLSALGLAMLTCGFLVLVIAGAETGPAAFGLAVLLAILPVPIYLALVLFIDRFEPEPMRMIVLTFLWGATIATFVAIILNTLGQAVVEENLGAEAAEIYGGSISAPVVEEGVKGLVLFGIFWWKRDEFNGVIDGIVYAALVGLGFAMTENVLYYGRGAAEEGVVGAVATFVVRGLLSPFAHPLFTAMTGLGLGLAVNSRSRTFRFVAPLVGLVAAMVLHSLWNTAAGAGLFLGAYVLIMVPIFLLMWLVIVFALRREGRVIAQELDGLLPPDEVRALSTLSDRRRARKAAKQRGGRRAKRAMTELQHTASELAFHRQRGRTSGHRDRLAAARESALLATLAQRRRELQAVAG